MASSARSSRRPGSWCRAGTGYVAIGECDERLAQSQLWVREPLSAWLGQRWTLARDFRYHVAGRDRSTLTVSSLP